jgi:hypothetical protein
MNWTKYGQWRHPILWWHFKLNTYFKKSNPDTLQYNPTVVRVTEFYVMYTLANVTEIQKISKADVIGFLNPELN